MKKIIRVLVFGLSLAFLGFSPRGYQIGDTVSDFSLKNVDGKMVFLSSYQGNKGLIIIFDCNTCPYSKAYNERIIALSKKYNKIFPLIAINSNDPRQSPGDSFDRMVAYAKKKGYDFPYLVDESQETARTFGATNTPHVFVLKKVENSYQIAYIGTIDNSPMRASDATKKYVEAAVDACLADKNVEIVKTKAVGCGIKWK